MRAGFATLYLTVNTFKKYISLIKMLGKKNEPDDDLDDTNAEELPEHHDDEHQLEKLEDVSDFLFDENSFDIEKELIKAEINDFEDHDENIDGNYNEYDEDDYETKPKAKRKKLNCDLCDFSTASRSHLVKHKNANHEYSCDECEFKGSHSEVYKHRRAKRHEDHKVTGEKRFKCDQCENSYTESSTLKDHISFVHDGVKAKCKDCDYEGSRGALASHILKVHKKQHQCDICLKSFKSSGILKDHIQFVHEGIKLKCKLCDFMGSKTAIHFHNNLVHNEKFKCDYCDYKASRSNYLRDHIESTHMGISHDCDVCGKNFKTNSILKIHKRDVHDETFKKETPRGQEKSLLCDQCEYRTNNPTSLKRHIESVHLKKYVCSECKGDFSSDFALKGHILRKHEDTELGKITIRDNKDKIYNCNQCEFKTQWPKGLQDHIDKKHDKEILSCNLCDYTTTMPKEFDKHWGYRHDHSSKRYLCDQCHYSSTFNHALKLHVQMIHEKIRYPCGLCDYSAGSQGDLKTHNSYKHDKSRVKCDFCDLDYASGQSLRSHVKTKHPEKYVTRTKTI